MARVYDNQDLVWVGNRLGLPRGPKLVEITPDRRVPTLWRVRQFPMGEKTTVRMNIVRARTYARRMALEMLNTPEMAEMAEKTEMVEMAEA